MKTCSKCEESKPLEAYGNLKSAPDGMQYKCKECVKVDNFQRAAYKASHYLANKKQYNARSKARYSKNVVETAAYSKKYRADNAERIKTQKADYRANNLEKVKESEALWRANNREKKAESDKAYRLANPEKIAEHYRKWQANNKDKVYVITNRYRLANLDLYREASLRRRASKSRNGVNVVSAKETAAITAMPCTACAAPGPSTVDHIVPIARGGAHSIGNLMPLCGSCNSSKNDLLYIEWKHSNRPQAKKVFAA